MEAVAAELVEEVTRNLKLKFLTGEGMVFAIARQMMLFAMKEVGQRSDLDGAWKKKVVMTSVRSAMYSVKESGEWYRSIQLILPLLSDYTDDLIAAERGELCFNNPPQKKRWYHFVCCGTNPSPAQSGSRTR